MKKLEIMKRLIVFLVLLATTGESRAVPLTKKQVNIYTAIASAVAGALTTVCLYYKEPTLSQTSLLAAKLESEQMDLKFDVAKFISDAKSRHTRKSILIGLITAAATGTLSFFVFSNYVIVKVKPTFTKRQLKPGYMPEVKGFLKFYKEEFARYDLHPICF